MIALAGLVLLWIALARHPVGDYYTESDFYGGYAQGARLLQHGRLDPARYGVVGPVYEVALELTGFVVPDLFLAAKLLSVAAACGTLALWYLILGRRAGWAVGAWTAALIAANPVFVRYGYSATTDMLSTFLQAAAVFALLAARGRFAPVLAGGLAALATLTRYSAIELLPAGLLCYAWLAPADGMSRLRACGFFLAGFAAVLGPWLVLSAAAGHLPGEGLLQNFGFYADTSAHRNVQDRPGALLVEPPPARSLRELLRHDAPALALQALRNIPAHLARDARELLGWPVAAACLAGAAFAATEPAARGLVPVWALGAALFASLVPVFYSDRYSLPLAPTYLALAGVAAASPRFALVLGRPGVRLKGLLALLVLALSIRGAVAYKRYVDGMVPFEVVEAGRAIAREAPRGARVMSRKGHIGYYAGLDAVPFPRFDRLSALAEYCRRERASYLYYSWYEAQLRPEFAFLLDTTARVPGLTRIFTSARHPAVVYRIGPEFGVEPPWLADPFLRRVHVARALAGVLPDSLAAPHRILLASLALDEGRPAEALDYAGRATRGRPRDPLAWSIAGEALRALGRPIEAKQAYETALALDPGEAQSRVGLGWIELGLGHPQAAARVWRPVIGEVTDPATREAMARLYDQLGDAEAARAARAARPGR